jgi:hypothetical protein
MTTPAPKPPSVRGLERLLAVVAALACLFITIAIWRDVSTRQAMWPLPALYFIELPAVGIVSALAFLGGYRYTSSITWAAAGIYVAFGLLGAFSVGLCYAPIAIMFIMLAVLVMVRREERFLQSFVPFLIAAVAQAGLMLLAIRLLSGQ